MGKDSEFYKDKSRNQKLQLRSLIRQLPGPAVDYIYSKEVQAQPSTLISYCYDLLTFFTFLQDNNPACRNIEIKNFSYDILAQIAPEDVVEFQRYLELNIDRDHPHENSKKAIARKMSPLRSMFHYHVLHKHLADDPMQLVPLPNLKKDKNIVRMNNYEVRAILDAIEQGNEQMSERQRKFCLKTQKRDLAILTLMLGTGIRVSECNGLDLDDVDLTVNSFNIVRKGGGQDVLYFGDDVAQVLTDYITTERAAMHPKEGHEKALFFSLQGKRISVDAIEKLVKKYAKMVVPNKKITPHKLRSTFGTALYRETGDIRLVANVLGHNNINTTIQYYAAIEDEHKKKAAGAVDYKRED